MSTMGKWEMARLGCRLGPLEDSWELWGCPWGSGAASGVSRILDDSALVLVGARVPGGSGLGGPTRKSKWGKAGLRGANALVDGERAFSPIVVA